MTSLLLTFFFACSDSPPAGPAPDAAPQADAADAAELIQVRLALNWFPEPEFGGFYEGVAGGIYKDAGFDVTIIPGGPGAPTMELLERGKAEAAITAADDLLVKRSKGVQAVAVWAGFQNSPVGLLTHADSGLGSITDLADHPELRVAIEIGSPFQQWLWHTRELDGKVATVPTTGSVAAFLADKALVQQAYITSEPCVAKGQGADVRFLPAADAGWNPYGTVLALSSPPPPWAADFVAATQRAWEAYVAAPARGNAEIARLNDQLTPDLLACITEAQQPFLTGDDGLGVMREERWRHTRDALVTVGLLKADSPTGGAWIDLQAKTGPTP